MSVTVISCIYGERGYDRFIGEWQASLRALTTRPHEIIVVSDRSYEIPCAHVFTVPVGVPTWKYPQAQLLDRAVRLARSEWVWILDMDDRALSSALDGVADTEADVLLMGYEVGGEEYVPAALENEAYAAGPSNPYPAGSAFRRDAFIRAGGFPDIAFQDWGLWRRLARSGARFATSGRTHYEYVRHPRTRTSFEFAVSPRFVRTDEMLASEHASA